MGVLLSTIRGTLNLLLPFTNQNTPLIQDLIHTVILCGTLYFAPQIAEYNQTHYTPLAPIDNGSQTDTIQDPSSPNTPTEAIPIDENLILQPDTDNEDIEPPPLAPTPPPGQARAPPVPAPEATEADGWPPNNFADPGPADADRPHATPANRVIGTKKARSLARRDQRRAYHEFQREQAEIRRREEAEGKEEREAALAAEKARRAEVEREIAEQQKAERDRKKEEERREQEGERRRRERVVQTVREEVERKGAVDLVDLAWEEGKDKVWIEKLVRASGMMGQMEKEDEKVMITGDGWLVRIDAELMEKAYADAVTFGDAHNGKVSFADFGDILENAVRARAAAAA